MRTTVSPCFRPLAQGLTLIEMITALAIIAIIATVAITSETNFNKSLILANAAYDVALTIRSAEIYGLGGRVPAGSALNVGYGLEFTKAQPKSFAFFADTYPPHTQCHPASPFSPTAQNGNCVYDAGVGKDDLISTYTFGNNLSISDFCAYNTLGSLNPNGGTWSCANNSNYPAITFLDIVFARPSPSPFISQDRMYSSNITRACIILTSPQGGSRYIGIDSTGEITADATQCPLP